MSRYLALLAVLFIYNFSSAQSKRIFTEEELREDLQFLKKSIETYNPALGIFHRDSGFETVYDSLITSLKGEMTDLEFYPFAVRLAAATNEGHMQIGSSSDTVTSIFRGFFDRSFEFIPLSVRYVNGEVRVWGNFSPDSAVQRGDRILRINGQPVEDIVQVLKSFAITDGHIPTAKRHKVIDNFGAYYFWFYERPQQFEISYQSYRSDELKTTTIPAIHRDSMISWRNERYGVPEKEEPGIEEIYEFNIEGNIAYLQLKNFSRQLMEQFKVKPRKLYKEIFKELREKEIAHLVLDVRGNGGGRDEYTWELLPYLMKEDYSGVAFQDVSWKGKRFDNRFPKQSKWFFEGQLYVLTDAATYSNGAMAAMYAKDFGEAVVIGKETSSRYEGWAGGSRQSVTLPNTQIPVRIPRYLLIRNPGVLSQATRNRGLIPDYLVSYTFADLLQERDKVREKVEQLISDNLAGNLKP